MPIMRNMNLINVHFLDISQEFCQVSLLIRRYPFIQRGRGKLRAPHFYNPHCSMNGEILAKYHICSLAGLHRISSS